MLECGDISLHSQHFERLMLEDNEFKSSLGYTMRPCRKTQEKNRYEDLIISVNKHI